MESYHSDEEQIQALRNWWKSNGTSTLLAVVIALAGWFGWQAWHDHRQQQADAASVLYQQLLELDNEIQRQPNKSRLATAQHLAEQLRQEHGSSVYAQYAAALWAKIETTQNHLDAAAKQYRWILQHKPAPSVERLTRLRLAAILFDQGSAKVALAMLDAVDPAEFRADFDALRGDIYLKQGQVEKARQAWERAQAAAAAAGDERPLLKIKLDNLPPAPAEKTTLPAETPAKQDSADEK